MAKMEKSEQKNQDLYQQRCKSYFTSIQALLFIVNGIFWCFIFPTVFREILEAKMMIKPGSIGFEAWKKSSIPTKIK